MARGVPRLCGVILGVPTIIAGGVLFVDNTGSVPSTVGYPFVLLGMVAILVGTYVHQVAPEQLELTPVETFSPSQLGAYLLGGTAMIPLVVTLYLLIATRVPYVWPTLAFVVFVVLLVKALVRYWQNSLTTYYLTQDDRIVSEYRFLSLRRSSVRTNSVQSVVRE